MVKRTRNLPRPRGPVLTFLNEDACEFLERGSVWRKLLAVADGVLRPLGACGLCGQGPIYRVSIWPVDEVMAIATGFCAKCYDDAHNVRGSVAERALRRLSDVHRPWDAKAAALNRHHRLLAKQKARDELKRCRMK